MAAIIVICETISLFLNSDHVMVLLFNIIHHVAQRNIPILYPVQPPLHPIHV